MKFFKKTKDEEPTAPGQVAIKKRSRVPGVMITQFVEELPVGMTTPDFTLKPIALTIQEGKCAVFKAIVSGNPTPSVHWTRSNGEVTEPERYKMVSDPATPYEHYIEMPEVSPEQADTYKCFATNEYGKAVVTANLNVIEMGYKKGKAMKDARAGQSLNFNHKTRVVESDKDDKKEGEIDPRFWDVLMSADKKDYEKICAEFGVTNFRWMLKTLNAKKVEREEEQAKYVEKLSNLKHIEVKPGGGAEFEFEMSLKDPNVKIFLFKNGVMVPFSVETEEKHFLKKTGRKFTFGIKDLAGDDEGLYQVMVEGVLIFSTDFKVPMVDFLVKIQEVKATEREDAVFECVLSSPMSKIQWTGRNQPCEQGDKFDIEVSEDMLIHTLVVKDCAKLDGGIYSVCAGIKSCNAFLVVEVDSDPATKGKKKVHKFSMAFSSFKSLNFESAPSFLVPLKTHSTPESYECYMSCAVRGDPTPHVTWYRNNISLNTNTNYLITNTCGVCSMLILRVGTKDTGEYKVIADNALGRAECSTKLTVNELKWMCVDYILRE
uniref:Immunoglobulin like and fibronectin type III domain containing 1, tandem duplicate 3 n=1 Tax=Oncorhynchus mykiss TaxID=8022 RepID=A0A8C7VCE5_ONCMY